MIQLTKRQKSLILDLMKEPNSVSAKVLAGRFNVSARTIRYDLDNISYWLKQRGIILEKKQKMGIQITLDDEDMKKISKDIQETQPYTSVLTQQDRKHFILLELLKSDGISTSEGLSEKLGVSRATTIKDLKEVKKELSKYGLILNSKQGSGYKVVGNENNVRQIIGNILLTSMDTQKVLHMLSSFEKESIFSTDYINEVSNTISIHDIKKAIKSSKKTYNFWIPDYSYVSLIIHIAIALDRLLKGLNIDLPVEKINMIKKHKEYVIAMEIGRALTEAYHVEIPEAELANITIHLLSADLKMEYVFNENLIHEDEKIESIIEEMLNNIKKDIEATDESIKKLKADLISHLKLTLKKSKLNIHTENPLIGQIKANYKELYDLAEKMANIFTQRTDVELSDNEVGYVTLHLAAHAEMIKGKAKKKALIVCTTGKGTAKILAMRIKNNIPDLEIKEVISIFELEDNSHLIEEIDLIISTVDVDVSNKPVFKVSPIITNMEMNKIRNSLYQDTKDIMGINNKISLSNIDAEYINGTAHEKSNFSKHLASNKETLHENQSQVAYQMAEDTAIILTEVASMIKELNLDDEIENIGLNIWGIIIHIIMAIPRWKYGQYNVEVDIEAYKENHTEVYHTIRKYLDKIAKDYNLIIPDGEVIAIMRYLIKM
ncbi:BglG family transcription antiterminator [Alkaliphilus peptidifermentans]|uniref:Transcriptional antiterminator n=1 Tax=Alkaliphilus peptidifermentans DSM 18978 TaxID=1120976 RepID=A0A1G5ITQ0_9FIRM|nr:transcription antiterminator [Alkaliphilus peptidifermentans]SCY79101.1 Transcriptional antiterminator [Alkaliphilus peptidifermentans DSM 18978]